RAATGADSDRAACLRPVGTLELGKPESLALRRRFRPTSSGAPSRRLRQASRGPRASGSRGWHALRVKSAARVPAVAELRQGFRLLEVLQCSGTSCAEAERRAPGCVRQFASGADEMRAWEIF